MTKKLIGSVPFLVKVWFTAVNPWLRCGLKLRGEYLLYSKETRFVLARTVHEDKVSTKESVCFEKKENGFASVDQDSLVQPYQSFDSSNEGKFHLHNLQSTSHLPQTSQLHNPNIIPNSYLLRRYTSVILVPFHGASPSLSSSRLTSYSHCLARYIRRARRTSYFQSTTEVQPWLPRKFRTL